MNGEEQIVVELSDIEKSAIGEVCDLMTASMARTFGDKLNVEIGVDPSVVEVGTIPRIAGLISAPILLLHFNFTSGIEGQFFLGIGGEGLTTIFDLAIPDDVKEADADDGAILDAIREIVNGAIYEAMTSLADSMGYNIDCSVIDTIIMQDESELESISFLYPEGKLLYASTELDLSNSRVGASYFLPISLSTQIIDLLLNEQAQAEDEHSDFDSPASITDLGGEQDVEDLPLVQDEMVGISAVGVPKVERMPQVSDLQPARFDQLAADLGGGGPNNISLLLDVALDASIELGKTQMTIENILKLGRGSVIELDKLASEPVEFLVNGKVIARGEVVVIDDNFGIRITEILSPKERLENI